MQRINAVKAIAQNLRDLVSDTTPSAVTGSTITANSLVHPVSNQLRGQNFYIYGGAGNGQERIVATFNPTSNQLGFDFAFSSLPSTNSTFILLEKWNKQEYDNAIDQMVRQAKMRYLEPMVATMSLIGTQYEYAVPSGMKYINNIKMVPSGNSDYPDDPEVHSQAEFPPRYWSIGANPLGSYLIMFHAGAIALDDFDGEWVRIAGQAEPNIGTLDTAVIPSDIEQYIIDGASMLLASQMIDEDNRWRTRFYMFRDNTKEDENYISTPRRGKPVR